MRKGWKREHRDRAVNCFSGCCGGGSETDVKPLLLEDVELEKARHDFEQQKKWVELLRETAFSEDKRLRPTLPAPDESVVHPKGRQLADMYRKRLK